MSLQLAAKHLESKGRGPDDTLVHMSRGEVKSLNDLAMAHGGHLTINPQTGLPEAGFLSMLLPIVAGAALGPAGMGLSAGMAGLAGGALSYALNPKAGLMGALSAGMGAYGGAGLGDALAQQGMEQATTASLANNPEYLAQQKAFEQKAIQGFNPSPEQVGFDQAKYTQGLQNDAATQYGLQQKAYDAVKPTDFMGKVDMMGQGVKSAFTDPNGFSSVYNKLGDTTMSRIGTLTSLAAPAIAQQPKDTSVAPVVDKDMGQRYSYSAGAAQPLPTPDVPSYDAMLTQQDNFGKEQNYYPTRGYTKVSKDEAKNIYGFAGGGMPVEQMSNNSMMGVNTMYPMANISTSSYGTPDQMAEGGEANAAPAYTYDPQTQRYTSSAPAVPMGAGMGEGIGAAMSMAYNPQTQQFSGGNLPTGQIYLGGGQYGIDEATKRAQAEAAAAAASNMASGGLSNARYNLGGYSDGGRLLRGPGDGVSDSIPAMIGKKQPARLADGEFVVPARIVSEIGNGSTEAGARKLYAMMDRVQSARRQTVGKGKVAKNSRADKYLPA